MAELSPPLEYIHHMLPVRMLALQSSPPPAVPQRAARVEFEVSSVKPSPTDAQRVNLGLDIDGARFMPRNSR